jgi:hypothetical protein
LQNQEPSLVSSDENISSPKERYWSAQEEIETAIAEGPQFDAEQSNLPTEKDLQPDEEKWQVTVSESLDSVYFSPNQQNKESRSPGLETEELPEAQKDSSAIRKMTREFDAEEQPQSESSDLKDANKVEKHEENSPESSADLISELHLSINLENLQVDETTPRSTLVKKPKSSTLVKKPKSIVSQPSVRKNWLVRDDNDLPWWERLSTPRIYKPTPFYIPPFIATPYIFDPSTPRRTKKTDSEKEQEKYVFQMSDRSRKIMQKKVRKGNWWTRMSTPRKTKNTTDSEKEPEKSIFQMSHRSKKIMQKKGRKGNWWTRMSTPRRTKNTDSEKEQEKTVLQMSHRSKKIMQRKRRTGSWWTRLSTPRRTKKPGSDEEMEKFSFQMCNRSRAIMQKKSRTGDWWHRLSKPKTLR